MLILNIKKGRKFGVNELGFNNKMAMQHAKVKLLATKNTLVQEVYGIVMFMDMILKLSFWLLIIMQLMNIRK